MKKFFEEFKNFIAKGNVIDMATAVIIGAAFNKIITSLVNDVVMPLISLLVGGLNVTDWKWVISPEVVDEAGVVVTAENALRYGVFIQAVIDFLIVAFCIFVALKLILSFKTTFQNLKKKEEEAAAEVEEPAPEIPVEQQLLTEIRDLLKEKDGKN
ncbi:MAG: large-conductance mechanosensitive channel protein MscL [Ruminococcaceae bacterium]|nr:large-conductance mechanosensitive channel protein MscL [Oscillospiraceae bacterium]